MRSHIVAAEGEPSDALRGHVRRVLRRALGAFREVEAVTVELRRLDGPRAGIDKQCTLTTAFARPAAFAGREAVTRATSDEWTVAVSRAATRLRRAVASAVEPSTPPAPIAAAAQPPIVLTEPDLARLMRVVERAADHDAEAAARLERELDRAEVVPASRVPSDVVTMRSRVVFHEEVTGKERAITLVYPHEADPKRDRVSVLAPVGSALIGLRVGQTIRWPLPRGVEKELRVVAVQYQPEAAGELHR